VIEGAELEPFDPYSHERHKKARPILDRKEVDVRGAVKMRNASTDWCIQSGIVSCTSLGSPSIDAKNYTGTRDGLYYVRSSSGHESRE
jgi:hypothetical protein